MLMLRDAQASRMLSAACMAPQVGLRTLNPHVTAAIAAAGTVGNAGLMLPRQHASMATEGQTGYGGVAGISSFAFQVCATIMQAVRQAKTVVQHLNCKL